VQAFESGVGENVEGGRGAEKGEDLGSVNQNFTEGNVKQSQKPKFRLNFHL